MDFPAARVLGWLYTVVAIVLVARLALRPLAPGREPLAWITVLILATMRSPLLSIYAPFHRSGWRRCSPRSYGAGRAYL